VTTARSRKLGLGFNWSADATRTETLGFFYSFEELANANIDTAQCKPSQGPYLSSDLKITDFLMKGLDMSFQDGMLFPKTGESPYETFTYDVKFIVTTAGTINPSWTLLRVSIDPSGNLFGSSRIHTDDLTTFKGTRHPAGVMFCMRQAGEAAAIIASQDGRLSLAAKNARGVVRVLGSYERAFGWR